MAVYKLSNAAKEDLVRIHQYVVDKISHYSVRFFAIIDFQSLSRYWRFAISNPHYHYSIF